MQLPSLVPGTNLQPSDFTLFGTIRPATMPRYLWKNRDAVAWKLNARIGATMGRQGVQSDPVFWDVHDPAERSAGLELPGMGIPGRAQAKNRAVRSLHRQLAYLGEVRYGRWLFPLSL